MGAGSLFAMRNFTGSRRVISSAVTRTRLKLSGAAGAGVAGVGVVLYVDGHVRAYQGTKRIGKAGEHFVDGCFQYGGNQ